MINGLSNASRLRLQQGRVSRNRNALGYAPDHHREVEAGALAGGKSHTAPHQFLEIIGLGRNRIDARTQIGEHVDAALARTGLG